MPGDNRDVNSEGWTCTSGYECQNVKNEVGLDKAGRSKGANEDEVVRYEKLQHGKRNYLSDSEWQKNEKKGGNYKSMRIRLNECTN